MRIIRNIGFLDLVRVLGSPSNAEELELLLLVIECTNFASLSDDLLGRVEVRCLTPGRHYSGYDCLFYKPHNERALTYKEY